MTFAYSIFLSGNYTDNHECFMAEAHSGCCHKPEKIIKLKFLRFFRH